MYSYSFLETLCDGLSSVQGQSSLRGFSIEIESHPGVQHTRGALVVLYCSLLVHSTPWCIVVYAPSSTTDAELVLSYITYTYIVTSACNAITSAPPASQPAGSNKHRHRRLIMTRTDQLMLTSCTLPVDREKRKKHDKCRNHAW